MLCETNKMEVNVRNPRPELIPILLLSLGTHCCTVLVIISQLSSFSEIGLKSAIEKNIYGQDGEKKRHQRDENMTMRELLFKNRMPEGGDQINCIVFGRDNCWR